VTHSIKKEKEKEKEKNGNAKRLATGFRLSETSGQQS